jgi:hypothetical protein
MKPFEKIVVLIVTIVCFGNPLMAQEDILKDESTKDSDSSYLSVSLNYLSDAVFMGRRDSISAPYLYTSLMYHHKSGFYGSGSVSYLTRADEGRVDLFLLTAGFDFTIKKLDGDISFTTYFFNEDSYNVLSEVSTDLTAGLEYDFNIINLGLSASTYFSNDSSADLFLSSEISHDFITKNEKFQFSPTVGISFGTQNFYEQYFVNNRFGNGRGQGQGNSSTVQSTAVQLSESEKFNLMAIEFSLPIWYEYNSFNAVFVPTFVIPQNEATLSVDDILVNEDLDNTFYFIAGIYYRF